MMASSRGRSLSGSRHARSPARREEAASTELASSNLMPSSICSEWQEAKREVLHIIVRVEVNLFVILALSPS